MSVTTTGYKVGKQPIAQSFYVDEPRGIYCTKFDLFFKTADENAPVQIQIRPMVNDFHHQQESYLGLLNLLREALFLEDLVSQRTLQLLQLLNLMNQYF